MRNIPLIIPFLLALFVQLYGPIYIHPFRLIAFAPFLAIAFQRLEFLQALWTAALIGLLVDATSYSFKFGFFALIYTLTAWIAHKQRRHFFEDKPVAISLYTSLISCLVSCLQMTLNRLPVDSFSLLTDLLAMPLIDGLYAFLWFTCPLQVYTWVNKKWKYF